MKSSEKVKVRELGSAIAELINDYVEGDDGTKESTRVAVAMTAVTKVLASMATSLDVPQEITHAALDTEIEWYKSALADYEKAKH